MPIKFTCKCDKRLQAPSRYASKFIKCPSCGVQIKVPAVVPKTSAPVAPKPGTQPPATAHRPASPQGAAPASQGRPAYQRKPLAAKKPKLRKRPSKPEKKSSHQVAIIAAAISAGVLLLIVGGVVIFFILKDKSANSASQSSGNNGTEATVPAEPVNEIKLPPIGTTLEIGELTQLIQPAVVQLRIKTNRGDIMGTGIFLNNRGSIFTSYHLMQKAHAIEVIGHDNSVAQIKGYLEVNTDRNLAAVLVDPTKFKGFAPIPIAKELPKIGDAVAAFGWAQGSELSGSRGNVVAMPFGQDLSKTFKDLIGIDAYILLRCSIRTRWIQITPPISGANSGGPLVNMRGELVGINNWSVPDGSNMNFALSLDEIKELLQNMNVHGRNLKHLPMNYVNFRYVSKTEADEASRGDSNVPPGFGTPDGNVETKPAAVGMHAAIDLPRGFSVPSGVVLPAWIRTPDGMPAPNDGPVID